MGRPIPVEEVFAEWRKDPEYVAAYDALEEEFGLAAALIQARARAGLTQEQVAQRMGTTQASWRGWKAVAANRRRAPSSALQRRPTAVCGSSSSRPQAPNGHSGVSCEHFLAGARAQLSENPS